MAKSNDEIYDLLVQIDKALSTHKAETSVRLDHLEARNGRLWQVRLSLALAALAIAGNIVQALPGTI